VTVNEELRDLSLLGNAQRLRAVPSVPRDGARRSRWELLRWDASAALIPGRLRPRAEPGGGDAPKITARLTNIMLRLHAELCAGAPGKLFLGVTGMLFVAATVSGVVLYAPSMRKLDFWTVRRQRSPRLYWLDLHNLLGIVTVAWTQVQSTPGLTSFKASGTAINSPP
jgi:uncharacterized iron-regulated membrane protein